MLIIAYSKDVEYSFWLVISQFHKRFSYNLLWKNFFSQTFSKENQEHFHTGQEFNY